MNYSLVSLAALLIHLVMNHKYLRNKVKKTEVNRKFKMYVWAALGYYVTDSLWGIIYDLHIPALIYIITYFYYITMALSVVMLCRYVTEYLSLETAYGKFINIFGFVFAASEIILLFANHFVHLFFEIDADGVYHAGNVRYIVLYIHVLLCLMLAIHAGYVMTKADVDMRRRFFTILLFCIEMTAALILQILYPLVPYYAIGLVLGISILHTFVEEHEKEEQYKVLDSMASIYYSMHVINLTSDTVDEFSTQHDVKSFVNHHRGARQMMMNVMTALTTDEHREAALEFTDLSTLADRMKGKKNISAQFVGLNTGWFLALFIATETDKEGKPTKVIYATRVVDEEKKQEEKLLHTSLTDELTGLYNRRAYEDDLILFPDVPPEQDFVYAAIDINGLKVVNDNIGHAAGDELIKGAAYCLKRTLGNYGKVYRTGGDEFVSMFFVDEAGFETVTKDLENITLEWEGELVSELTLSIGYVSKREFPTETVTEMSKIADKRMYKAKADHYAKKGVDRRGQAAAHTALCKLYTKILKINLTTDSYQVINMDTGEQTKAKGFADKISEWLRNFALSGHVHPDDLDEYLRLTDIQYMKDYFTHNKTSHHVFYSRRYENGFKQVMMEIIPADDYSDDNQSLFLYVKDIDK